MAALFRLLLALVAALTLHGSPAIARVPPGVRSIGIRSTSGVTAGVTEPAQVEQIVRWFDALPRFTPLLCPASPRRPPSVAFDFLAPGPTIVLRAVDHDPGSCGSYVGFGNEGQVKYPALADDGFVARVSRLLGVDFDRGATTAASKRLARQDASSLLGLVAVPPGSSRVTKAPDKRLDSPTSTPGTTALVDRHRIWKVHESVDQVFAFEHAHRPTGSRETGTGASDWGPSPSEDLVFSFPQVAGRISSRELDVNMVPLPNGWTGIRVDAQDIWVVARPPSEKIPAGVREIEIGNPTLLTIHRIAKPAQVRTIIRWFDALPVNQPGVFHCPPIRGPLDTITFVGTGGKVLATASVLYNGGSSGPCNPIAFSIGGQKEKPLLGGRFLARVQRLAG